MEKPKIQEVIAVEGRYDKNTLLQVVDASVLELGGFGIFNDREKTALLRRLAETRGIILFTDPDGAGFVIRNHLKGILPPEQVKQAYVPDVYGKERRKKKGGREGKLGVEGMPPQVLIEALRRAGATFEDGTEAPQRAGLTKADMLEKGLIEEAGRLDLPGRPVSFRTTDTFLRAFGLSNLADLPPVHGQGSAEASGTEKEG